MESPLKTVEKNVNLQSYSMSQGFLGFFERKEAFSIDVCEKAIDLLLSSSLFDTHCQSIVSNLFIVGNDFELKNDYGFGDRELREHVYPLAAESILTRVDTTQYCANRLDGYGLLEIPRINERIIRTVFSAVMSVDGIRGHCFCVVPDHDLILYPHDDSGFGFISTSREASRRQYLQDWIVRRFSDNAFEVTVF